MLEQLLCCQSQTYIVGWWIRTVTVHKIRMHTVCALLCFATVKQWSWSSGFFHWHIALHKIFYILFRFLVRRRFGDVFRIRFGHRPVVVLCGSKAVREALVEKSESFSERPDWSALVNEVTGGKGIIFNLHDWQFTRRFAMTTLRDFGAGKSPIEEACIDEINVITEEFNRQQGKPFNCQTLMPNAVSNIICGMVFNRRWDWV